MVYGDSCLPCDAWKVSPDKAAIEGDGVLIEYVHANDFPEPVPQVPYFIVHRGTYFARHQGALTYQRFRDIQSALVRYVGR